MVERIADADYCVTSTHPRTKFLRTPDGYMQCPKCYAYARNVDGTIRRADPLTAPPTVTSPDDRSLDASPPSKRSAKF